MAILLLTLLTGLLFALSLPPFNAEWPLYAPDVLVADVPLGTGTGTFFTRSGDWLTYACLLFSGAGLAALRRKTHSSCDVSS